MQPHTNTQQEAVVARFALGETVITPGAEEALQIAGQTASYLQRDEPAAKFIASLCF